jgi:outer membrane protein OmpA-like peptidoglycan-associated protein
MFRNPDTSIPGVFLKKNGGIDVHRLQYFGNRDAVGYFVNNTSCFGVEKGIVLSTGMSIAVASPNRSGNTGSSMGVGGDSDLSRIARGRTFDAAVILIDFIPQTDTIAFDYFFGSEEYPEFVDKGVNDVFAFLVRKKGEQIWRNIAVTPTGIPVTVDNINHKRNTEYFVSNTRLSQQELYTMGENEPILQLAKYFMFDGFTTLLKAGVKVEPGAMYEMKIALADVGDDVYDSGVFLAANSFEAVNYVPPIEKEFSELSKKYDNIETANKDNKITLQLFFAFAFDSHSVADADKPALREIASIIKQRNRKVAVHGHTDNVGTPTYNQELSVKRAQSVVNELAIHGVEKSFLTTIGFADTKPLSQNNTEEGRKRNRRVEIVFD